MAETEDKVVLKEKIPELRKELEAVADEIRGHIGSRGASHVDGNTEHPGFMSAELYNKLLGFRKQLDSLIAQTAAATLPEGSMLYWPKSETSIPDGFVLCNGYNGTLDMRGKFVMGATSDSDYGEISGRDSFSTSELPVPRHTHYFDNYAFAEIWAEIDWYSQAGSRRLRYYNNRMGTCRSWYTGNGCYPAAYYDSTVSTNVSGSASSSSVDLVPPYKSLAVIKKTSKTMPLAADGVGTVHIVTSNGIPEGLLELNGQVVSRTMYKGLYQYAYSNDIVLSESAWTSYKNTYGSVPYFGESSISGMFRLPLLQNSCLAVRTATAAANTGASTPGNHYHAFGSWNNNSGVWPAKGYSGASFPSGTQGVFWNGRGGGGWPSGPNPPYSGHYITSMNINVGSSGNGKLCDTNNLTFAIRAFHPESVIVTQEAVNTVKTYAAMTNKAVVVSDPDSVGDNWVESIDGTLSVWGEQEIQSTQGDTEAIVLPRAMKTKILTVKLQNTNPESDTPSIKTLTPESIIVNLGNHGTTDVITYYATGC